MPQPADASSDIQATLALTELCAGAVSKALLNAEPDVIESAARDLHRVSLSLAGLLQSRHGTAAQAADFKQRLGQVLRDMALQREALLRRSAMVERSLHSIVPAARATTYAGGATPYGRNARQSGAFKLLAA